MDQRDGRARCENAVEIVADDRAADRQLPEFPDAVVLRPFFQEAYGHDAESVPAQRISTHRAENPVGIIFIFGGYTVYLYSREGNDNI